MWLAALIMGVAGSLHCAGMCSPLAMSVTSMRSHALLNRVLYNLGRIFMYGMLGAVVAGIGYVLPIGKYQNVLSIALGVALIFIAVTGGTNIRVPFLTTSVILITNRIKSLFSRFIQKKNTGAVVLLGALNGMLPCGLSFLALSFCVTLSSPIHGFTYMLLFGIGTLPVMLGIVSLYHIAANKLKWNIRNITAGMMIISGILLIARVFIVHLPEGHVTGSDFVDIVICR